MLVMFSICLLCRLVFASKVQADADDASWWPLPRKGSGDKLPADADDACRRRAQWLSFQAKSQKLVTLSDCLFWWLGSASKC